MTIASAATRSVELRKTLEVKNSGSLRKRKPRSVDCCALYSRNVIISSCLSRTFVAKINLPARSTTNRSFVFASGAMNPEKWHQHLFGVCHVQYVAPRASRQLSCVPTSKPQAILILLTAAHSWTRAGRCFNSCFAKRLSSCLRSDGLVPTINAALYPSHNRYQLNRYRYPQRTSAPHLIFYGGVAVRVTFLTQRKSCICWRFPCSKASLSNKAICL